MSAVSAVAPAPAAASPSGLPRSKVFAFSLGHVLNDLCAACWFSYLLVVMHTVLGLEGWKAAVIMLSGQVADALATPLVGIYSDRAKGITVCGRYFGRRHIGYILGTLLVLVNFFFLFARCVVCDVLGIEEGSGADDEQIEQDGNNEIWVLLYYSLAAAIFNVGWAAVQVCHMALMPELSPVESVRVMLNSVRYAATVVSNLFVFLVLGLLIYVFEIDKIGQFHWLAYISLGAGTVTSIFFLAGTEEPRPKNEQREYDAEQRRKKEEAKAKSKHRPHGIAVNNDDDYVALSDEGEPSPSPTPSPLPSPPRDSASPTFHLLRVEAHAPATNSAALVSVAAASELEEEDEEADADADDDSLEAAASGSQGGPLGHSNSFLFESTLDQQLLLLPIRLLSWRCWLNQPEFWVGGTIYTLSRLVVNVSQVCLPFFVLDVLAMPTVYITILPCTVYVASMLAAALMKRSHAELGTKLTFGLGFALVTLGSGGMLFLDDGWTRWLIFPASLAVGLGNGVVMVCSGALTSELIGSRLNHAAFVFGSFSFGDKMVTGLALFLIQTYNSDSAAYMRLAATLPCIAAGVAAGLVIYFGVDLALWRHKHTLPCDLSDEQHTGSAAAHAANGESKKQPDIKDA